MVILSNSKNFQRIIEFPDNRLMIDLCGQLDSNLSKIEHEISVQIHRRGNLFEISGDQDDCGLATMVLQSLYSQLESGKCLEPGDIDATIRMPSEFFESDFRKNVNDNNHIKPSNSLFDSKGLVIRTISTLEN